MRKTRSIDKVPYPAPDVITKVIPAPTEGWDQISPLADMSPQRAPILDNWVPRPGFVETRKGYQTWVTSTLSSAIEAMFVYQQPNSVKMYAATASGTLLDVSSSATTAVVFATVFSTGRWQWTNFTPAGGSTVLQFVNGTDSLQQISGTVISSVSITNLSIIPGPPTTASFINIAAIKRRLWYVIKNSTIATFLATDAIQGPIAGYLDLGALWRLGGNLVAIGNWTVDGGAGPNDYTVFISSRGEASVFTGIDPTTSSWQLVGTFTLAPPIGRRCIYPLGSDLLVITQQGVLPISQVLPFDPSADRSSAITQRIQNAMVQASASYKDNFGWEIITYPSESLLFLNVPGASGTTGTKVQFVMNVLTGAWCRFTGWDADTFASYNNNLYFGDSSGNIQLAYTSGADGTNVIMADMQCAFNWFDNPGRLKRITFLQPLLTVVNDFLSPTIGFNVDFSTVGVSNPISAGTSGSVWDTAIWDSALWAGNVIEIPWLSINAFGKALALRMQLNYSAVGDSPPQLQVNAFNSVAELGGMV